MTPETLEALKGSIEKWEHIVAGEGEDHGYKNCPLCRVFRDTINGCAGCPVSEAVEDDWCDHTPYQEWELVTDWVAGRADTPKKKAAAQRMLDFLRSLLPKEEVG